MKRVLDFSVDRQRLSKDGDFSGLVAGSRGYLLARFSFSSDWQGYNKVAVFSCGDAEYPACITGGVCNVPDEAARRQSFRLYVAGRKGDTVIKSSRVTVIQRRF